jgi:hypothetical protein
MGLGERISSAAGRAIGGLGNVALDSFRKAGEAMAQNQSSEKEIAREGMPEASEDNPRALMYDPFAVIDQLGYKDRPSGITYQTLAEIARRVPVIAGIHQTRIRQLGNFAIPQEHKREPGFQVVMREEEDKPTAADRKRAKWIEKWVSNCGSTYRWGKDDFACFLEKYGRDSLTYDQGAFEVVDNRKGEPSDFYAFDAATARIADVPLGAELDDDPERVRYVQVYDEVVIAEFAAHEMCFGVRNPRTGIRLNGYGFSEIEMLLNVVTALLWAFEYNKRFFSQGSVTKGILNFKGSIPDSKMDGFRRHWYQMISGVANAWRTPVVNSDELQYIDLHSSNRDMEYSAWMDWLTKITCAIYQFDPAEINFLFGNQGQQSSMFQAPAESRIKSSKDRGLRPFLRHIAANLNKYLIWRVDENFKLKFTGLDPRDSQEIVDTEKKQVTFMMTVDEVRAQNDLEPLPDKLGEIILDPTFLQNKQAAEMAAQQEAMGEEGMPGMPGEEGEGGEGGDEQDQMMAQLQEVSPEEPEAEKSLRKASVRERRHGQVVTYELEF